MKRYILVLILLVITVAVYAQAPSLPPAPAAGGGPFAAAPLDGFTWMLLLSGIGYGAKNIRDRRKP